MLYYAVRTGLFGLVTNANFEHPTLRGYGRCVLLELLFVNDVSLNVNNAPMSEVALFT